MQADSLYRWRAGEMFRAAPVRESGHTSATAITSAAAMVGLLIAGRVRRFARVAMVG